MQCLQMIFKLIVKFGTPSQKKNIVDFQVMDRMLLRYITAAHAKVENKFLYLETGVIPLKEIISSRILMYLQNILKKVPDEIVRQVYEV